MANKKKTKAKSAAKKPMKKTAKKAVKKSSVRAAAAKPKKSAAPAKKKAAAAKPKPAAKKAAPTKKQVAAKKPVGKKAPAAKKAAPPKKAAAPKPTAPKPAAPKPPAAKPAAPVAAPIVPPIKPADVERLKLALEAKQGALRANITKNRDADFENTDEGIQDIADKATSSYNREFLYSLSDSERETLLMVEEALERIAKKQFGTCVACGGAVALARLEAVPWARHCVACQELQERGLLAH